MRHFILSGHHVRLIGSAEGSPSTCHNCGDPFDPKKVRRAEFSSCRHVSCFGCMIKSKGKCSICDYKSKTVIKPGFGRRTGGPLGISSFCSRPKPKAVKVLVGDTASAQNLSEIRPEKNGNCVFCKKVVRHHMDRHLRDHIEEKPYFCEICGASFGRKWGKHLHYKKMHKGKS